MSGGGDDGGRELCRRRLDLRRRDQERAFHQPALGAVEHGVFGGPVIAILADLGADLDDAQRIGDGSLRGTFFTAALSFLRYDSQGLFVTQGRPYCFRNMAHVHAS